MDKFKIIDGRIVLLGSANEPRRRMVDAHEGQGLRSTLRKGDQIIDSSESTTGTNREKLSTVDDLNEATATPDAAKAAHSAVVDRLAAAMREVRDSKPAPDTAEAAQSASDKLAAARRAVLDQN